MPLFRQLEAMMFSQAVEDREGRGALPPSGTGKPATTDVEVARVEVACVGILRVLFLTSARESLREVH